MANFTFESSGITISTRLLSNLILMVPPLHQGHTLSKVLLSTIKLCFIYVYRISFTCFIYLDRNTLAIHVLFSVLQWLTITEILIEEYFYIWKFKKSLLFKKLYFLWSAKSWALRNTYGKCILFCDKALQKVGRY